MKYKYPTISKKIKKYWLVELTNHNDLKLLMVAYKNMGINCKYTRLEGILDIICFYIGKEPKKFIKMAEYDLGSGQPN